MLNINISHLEGLTYTTQLDPGNTEWICMGAGQDPKSGVNYVVGTTWDQTSNRARISTHLLKDVTFKGQILAAK